MKAKNWIWLCTLMIVVGLVMILTNKCKKNEDNNMASPTRSRIEEAFPGIHGERQDFIINGVTITVEKINGVYVFQGDIILTEDQLKSGSNKGAGLLSFVNNWGCAIFYEINNNMLNKSDLIFAAIQNYELNTPLKFVHRTDQRNYIEFVSDASACSSDLGMIGGRQEIKIASWGKTGEIIHEIGHAIGLIHEHCRVDRDSYIIMIDSNIKPDEKDQFDIINTLYKTNHFDFNSIMMYDSWMGSISDDLTHPTMLKKMNSQPFYCNRDALSADDIDLIKLIYKNNSEPSAITNYATNISSTTATLYGTVNGAGFLTIVGFEYGTSTSYGSTVEASQSPVTGCSDTTVSANIIGLTENTTYYVRAYASNSVGTAYGNEITFTTSISIGDSYQGGIVAYILQSGDPGYIAGETHGLIAAPTDQSTGIQWYNGSYTITGATGTALGTGMANTNAIVSNQGAGSYAAKLCYDLVLGGYSDWYLPSQDELHKLYLNQAVVGGFTIIFGIDGYWSSTEYGEENAWAQFFFGGSQYNPSKYGTDHVRAIRAF